MTPPSRVLAAALLCAGACAAPPRHGHGAGGAARTPPRPRPGAVTLSIVGTNDLHGALERLPLLGGYVANLRAARAADGGAVLLIDAGDMFQGTLESNLGEGADVVRAYNALGYTASAVGNHEFDYGPVGPQVTARTIEDDARGALKARAREARFPMLVSNIDDAASGVRLRWPNMPASTLVEAAGVKVGILGLSTPSTPFTTMPANFVGLAMAEPALRAIAEARELRARGAEVVVVTAHMGSKCGDVAHAEDLTSCDQTGEIFPLVRALPHGLVDVVVAGHTHAAMAHRIDDVAVIESYSSGRAFGRVDLRISPTGHVTAKKIAPPQLLCPVDADFNPVPVADCHPGPYEGRPVVADAAVQAIADEALARAGERRAEKLGVRVAATITRAYDAESAIGNLLTDLMLAAHPEAEVAMTNGGGLRADLPAGELTYGRLFEVNPFDNRFATVRLLGKHLRRLVTTNLQRGGGIISWAGLTARAACKDGALDVEIQVRGKPLADQARYTLVTSDFLASGGDGMIGRLKLPEGSVEASDEIIREAMVAVLRKRGGTLDPASLLDPARPRLAYPGKRPLVCGQKPAKPDPQEPAE